jgi:hypothetical protein
LDKTNDAERKAVKDVIVAISQRRIDYSADSISIDMVNCDGIPLIVKLTLVSSLFLKSVVQNQRGKMTRI